MNSGATAGNAYEQAGGDSRPASDPPRAPHGSYYSDEHASPDLDANAPTLKSSELQRLNRKALVFLAGILVLLAVMIAWLLRGATSTERVPRPRDETVVIPELPRGPAAPADGLATPPARAIPMVEDTPPPLPPLPPAAPSYMDSQQPAPAFARQPPSLVQRRMTNVAGHHEGGPGEQADPYVQAMLAGLPSATPEKASTPVAAAVHAATGARFVSRPDALLVRGTYIRCVLETRIISDVAGYTSCIVTEPTYSINGRTLLLPKGSKLLGSYGMDDVGRERMAVVWDRLTTPDGVDVSMASPGVDALGGADHPGQRNAHWGSRVASALLVSLISDAFKYAGQNNGPTSTTTYGTGFVVEQPFESNTARAMERLADQALQDSAGRRATVTIDQGAVVNVYVARDVDFSQVLVGR